MSGSGDYDMIVTPMHYCASKNTQKRRDGLGIFNNKQQWNGQSNYQNSTSMRETIPEVAVVTGTAMGMVLTGNQERKS
jgi:hypothetical protein